MNLESDKRLNIQLRLDFSSAPTGEARQAGGEDIESLSRFMSYLPLLSFGPSATVSGSAYLLLRLSALECLTSLADDMT